MITYRIELILAVFCLAGAFLTSTWVNGISRLTEARAEMLMDRSSKRAKLLIRMAGNSSLYLTSTLVVMLILRVAVAVLVTSIVIDVGLAWPEVVATAVASFLLFQFVEIAPRTWALERLDQVLLLSARPVYLLGKVLGPLAAVLLKMGRLFLLMLPGRGLPQGPVMSEEEIKSILDRAQSEEVIEAGEREMLHSIFEFGDTVVREVMVPRPDIVAIDASATLEEVLELTLKNGFSRIPVYQGNIDDIAGIAYQKDVIRRLYNGNGARSRARKAGDIKREASFVPESKKVAELLREMQKTKNHMVIVVDEYGGVAGLATLEDLLEEIVGEITDEYDSDTPTVVRLDENTLSVAARVSIDELNERLGAELPHSQWDSVGGLVGGMLGRLPVPGDLVCHDGIEFEVQKMKGRRIDQVLVRTGVRSAEQGESREG